MLRKRDCQESEKISHKLEEMFAKDTSDKGLLAKACKELLKLSSEK